jgi:photosynthetic reaction center H subunit
MESTESYIDLAQIVLYCFWIFFAGLVVYLLRENKREGYPLISPDRRNSRVVVRGWPDLPEPKTFKLRSGAEVTVPRREVAWELKAVPAAPAPGSPLDPTGNPMLDGIGPAAYALRADVPDTTREGDPKIVPLRVAADHHLDDRDPDPRGLLVIGADGEVGGTVCDAWVDRSEALIRYLEVELDGESRRVLLPINFTIIDRRAVRVRAILGHQFKDVPVLRHPDQVTLLEEDRICGYYGGGTLYATPARLEPLL